MMEGVSESGDGVNIIQSQFGVKSVSNDDLDASILTNSQKVANKFCPSSQSRGLDKNSSNKRIGIPALHPRLVSQQVSQLVNGGFSHSRSLSQSSSFANDFLPPPSPLPHSSPESSQAVTISTENSMEHRPVGGRQGLTFPSSVSGPNNSLRGNEGLPPRRGHRRSMSDSVPLGFYSMIQSSPQLIPIGSGNQPVPGNHSSGVNSSVKLDKRDLGSQVEAVVEAKSEGEVADDLIGEYMNLSDMNILFGADDKELDSRGSGSRTNGYESSANEVESRLKGKREGLKRGASEDIANPTRHSRCLSMDSYVESLRFDVEALKLPPMGAQVDQQSPNNSMDEKLAKLNRELGNGEFSEMELKKIMANEKLIGIAMSDPKRVKRILANRQSAARSKERKMLYISELEQKVQTLQTEAITLSAKLTTLQRDFASLTSHNKELKLHLQAMEQQAHLKDALNEALVAEVQRLKITVSEVSGEGQQQFPGNQMFQQHSPQLSIYQQRPHARA